jgi:hypothetical protein
LKETVEYLQGIAKEGEQGKLKTRGFIKEFKACWPAVKSKEDLPISMGSSIFLCGLPVDVKTQLSAHIEVKVSNRSTYTL